MNPSSAFSWVRKPPIGQVRGTFSLAGYMLGVMLPWGGVNVATTLSFVGSGVGVGERDRGGGVGLESAVRLARCFDPRSPGQSLFLSPLLLRLVLLLLVHLALQLDQLRGQVPLGLPGDAVDIVWPVL